MYVRENFHVKEMKQMCNHFSVVTLVLQAFLWLNVVIVFILSAHAGKYRWYGIVPNNTDEIPG